MSILNIETSAKICSVALSANGMVDFQLEDEKEMNHAQTLAPFVEKCLEHLERRGDRLEAVAVSLGPGSYTGLRIGLSMAKGICFGRQIPLIGISTLKILAVKAMFRPLDWQGNEILAPMIDARRMEVYTAAYNFRLQDVVAPCPMILDEHSYEDVLKDHEVWFFGSGAEKAKEEIKSPHAHWIDDMEPHARDMIALSEKAFLENDFLDVAYSTPLYLKEYQTTKPKPKI